MDYCSSCRRHLNGALVCPGCGAYAPDIAPPVADGHSGSAPAMTSAGPATTADRDPAASVTRHDGLLDGEAQSSAAPHIASDVEDLLPARPGRAARRRRLARWRKNKRRAAVASAVALVGGGLSIAMMDQHTTDRAQAATAPDDPGTSAVQERTPQQNRPVSAPATARHSHRPSHVSTQPQPTNSPRQQSLAASPRTTSVVARPDTVAPAHPAVPATPRPQGTASAAGDTAPVRSGRTAQQQTAPATGDGTPGTPQTASPSQASTSPTQVCLLGLCLG
ncbi:SCO2400 family protein [Streptomyces sp. NPDC002550]